MSNGDIKHNKDLNEWRPNVVKLFYHAVMAFHKKVYESDCMLRGVKKQGDLLQHAYRDMSNMGLIFTHEDIAMIDKIYEKINLIKFKLGFY